MVKENILSVYDLDVENGEIVSRTGHKFIPKEYSRFKYGCNKTTAMYGELLAKQFIDYYGDIFKTEEDVSNIVIASSAYKYIPTASSYIMQFFLRHVNRWLAEKNLPGINTLKVYRAKLFQGDYGKMNEADRVKIFNDSQLYVDMNYVKGKRVIVIDDIRITGSHERKLASLMDGFAAEFYFLYIAILKEETAKAAPQIEDEINHCYVNSIEDVFHFIAKDRFFINARICKFILEEKDSLHLEKLLERLPQDRLEDIYDACIGDGYCHMDKYRKNFELIEYTVNNQ
jgi:hypoxanthine phosphoribosyltransferase